MELRNWFVSDAIRYALKGYVKVVDNDIYFESTQLKSELNVGEYFEGNKIIKVERKNDSIIYHLSY